MSRRWCELALVLLMSSNAVPAAGQEGPVTFEFSFSNPGARSMGLGGAFAALADDATAAYANPAGLGQLIDPEVSLEGRYSSYDIPFVQGGRGSGEPTGIGIDTVAGLTYGKSSRSQIEVPFAAFVYPVGKWSLALYRHTWADFELNSEINGLFGFDAGELARSEDVLSRTRVKVVNTGFSTAFELGEKFSLGLGVVYFESEMDSFSAEYGQAEEGFFERNSFAPELLDTTYSHTASDSGFALNAGFLWRVSPQWSLGGYFREGPRMTLRVVEVVGPFDDEKVEGTIELDATTPLNLPDVYGLGLAFRTRDGAWTTSLEWRHVEYSSITADLSPTVFDPGKIQIADGDELHLGIEYVLVRMKPILALRVGAWKDPAHRVEAGPLADTFEQIVFQRADAEIHLSAGLGLVFEHFQVDLGADFSETSDLASLSVVYRF